MQTFGEPNLVNEMADFVRDATAEVEALQLQLFHADAAIATLIAAGEQAMRALIELDGGDPTDDTGWADDQAWQAWRALTVAIAIGQGRTCT